jgi:pyridoxal phosphate phosphatase PHOSPHO2
MTRHGGWEAFDRVVYVGDGGNDFCPLLRLRTCVQFNSTLLYY